MTGRDLEPNHLDEQALQGLADGTLRGAEGFAAREHCEACLACAAELRAWSELSSGLSALADPALPSDFTARVLAAAEEREAHLALRRQHLLAALPAALLAVISLVGFFLSAGLTQGLKEILSGMSMLREVASVVSPLLARARIPIAAGAFTLCIALALALGRALRPPGRPSEA